MASYKRIFLLVTLVLIIVVIYLVLPTYDNLQSLNELPTSIDNSPLITKPLAKAKTVDNKEFQQDLIKINAEQGVALGPLAYSAERCVNSAKSHDNSQMNMQFKDYIATLIASDKSEDRLALFFQIDPLKNDVPPDFIFQLRPTPAITALLFEQQLIECRKNYNTAYCNESLYLQAAEIDNENAYLWHLIANIYFSQGKEVNAIKALNSATGKAYFNNYTYETINFIEQNLQENSVFTFNERLIVGIGVASATQGLNYSALINYCESHKANVDAADLCLQLGVLLDENSNSLMTHMVGLSLQEMIYKYEFNTDLLQETSLKRERYEETFINNHDVWATELLMHHDERLGRTWLSASLAKGEAFGLIQAIKEAKVYSQDENYNPCH